MEAGRPDTGPAPPVTRRLDVEDCWALQPLDSDNRYAVLALWGGMLAWFEGSSASSCDRDCCSLIGLGMGDQHTPLDADPGLCRTGEGHV
jgi:hypothetical protein